MNGSALMDLAIWRSGDLAIKNRSLLVVGGSLGMSRAHSTTNHKPQTTNHGQSPHRHIATSPNARAFTLIELMVVIGIIVMLVGLIVAVTVALASKSESREAENTLKLLDTALQEWENTAERQFTWGVDQQPPGATYDLQATFSGENQMAVALSRLKSSTATKDILARIDPDHLGSFTDTSTDPPTNKLIVQDPWGKRIIILHPGRLPQPAYFAIDTPPYDQDGTIRTTLAAVSPPQANGIHEQRFGVCQNRRICFISGGPDGKFGDLQLEEPDPAQRDQELVQQAADNLYSYPLLRENPG